MKKILIFLITIMLFIISCENSIKHRHINFLKSFSSDVSHYKLYVSKVPDKVTYKSKSYIIKEGLNCELDELTSRISIDLTNLIDEKGEYYIGVSAVSNSNEESKLKILKSPIILE